MPYTLNGIGTRYYGRRNESAIDGTCAQCGRFSRLSSYDTREFFCIFFIPVVPLRRFRIQSDCGSCRRHYRLSLLGFREQVESTVGPLRAAADSKPGDEEAQLSRVGALVDFGLLKDAEEAARAALIQLPRSAKLNRRLAGLVATRGDRRTATQYFREAVQAAPQEAELRLALGSNLFELTCWNEAARELEEARRLEPQNPQTLWLLGSAYTNASEWASALSVLEALTRVEPNLAQGRDVLSLVKKCKVGLGYPLSDAERKVDRWRWPWARRATSGAPHSARSLSATQVLVVLAVVAVAVTLVSSGVALFRQNRVDVYFDNGLKTPVTITVAGESFPCPPGPPVRRSLRPGAHEVVVASPQGEVERVSARIEKQPLWDALFSPRFYVYNVRGAHIYRRATHTYSADPKLRNYQETLIGFGSLVTESGVDYVFRQPPDTISSESKTDRKISFNVASDLDYNALATLRYGESKTKEAERALRQAIGLEPCYVVARRNIVRVLQNEDRFEEATRETQSWIATCPGDAIEGHRAYQDVGIQRGDRAKLVLEYRDRLRLQPEVALNHYLFGRVLADPDLSMTEYREALRLDPELIRARLALGYDLIALERYSEALPELEGVLDSKEYAPEAAIPYVHASIGAGTSEKARADLVRVFRDPLSNFSVWEARWALELALGQWNAAEALLETRAKQEGDPRETWLRRVQVARLQGDSVRVLKLLDEGDKQGELAQRAALLRFEHLLERGQYREAASVLDRAFAGSKEGAPRLYQIYAAAGLMMAGERTDLSVLADWTQSAESEEEKAMRALVEALSGRASEERVVGAARAQHYLFLQHAYFMLGARNFVAGDRTTARRLFEKSARTSVDMSFPLLAARRLTTQ